MAELKIISMDEVPVEEVEWLWYPYIPFGKLTIIHGDGGEGKTTLILQLAALLSRGEKLPCDSTEREPIKVIYQTAEDGLGDTIKPRLLAGNADCSQIKVIDESEATLTMLDERIEKRTRASVGKFERHIERKNESYENMNVDLSRTPMNVHFQGCGELTYNEHLDRLIADGVVSLKGLKADATVFNEMILDVHTDYFERNGGYDFACRFYEEAFHFAEKLYGKDNIISAVMHADELNIAMTEKYGKPIYHYHLHIMALPVVDKEVRWSKRCKDPALVGMVKEVIHQVSHSKK